MCLPVPPVLLYFVFIIQFFAITDNLTINLTICVTHHNFIMLFIILHKHDCTAKQKSFSKTVMGVASVFILTAQFVVCVNQWLRT